jgi:antitoxin component of RelBE/YafQ-DinJ toxin-antitoxin module
MNTVAISIKTDSKTKEQIKDAAERLGLSLSSFVIMVAKQAAMSPQILLNNKVSTPQQIDKDLKSNINIQKFDTEEKFFDHLDSLSK